MAKSKKKTKKTKKKSTKQRLKNRILKLKILAFLVITLAIYLLYCAITIPNIEEAISRTRQPSTTVIAKNGFEIQSFGQVYSEVVHVDELPDYVVDAIVSTEDRRFYEHFGFDIISFTRAMVTNVFARRYAQGGSTITQQVAKNLFLTPQKSIRRKVQELMLAFWLESKFTKEQILTLYLNRVYFGAGTFGIEAASQKYFQKSSRDLNLKEAAIVAGMLKAPSRYNPIASEERAIERAKVVLRLMVKNESITEDDMFFALKQKIGAEKIYKVKGGKYFADWVYSEVNNYIGERDSDINVYTTLDQDLQQKAENVLQKHIAQNKDRNVTQGAVVIMDRHGAIKAMVGGVNYEKSQFNRAVQALRQPGSSFKTFVYLAAFQKGWGTMDKIEDYPIKIGKWKPENYNKTHYGTVTLQEALARSLNLATVDLAEKIGRKNIISLAKKMGISTTIKNTPALSLGAFEVRVLDMATAYAVIANDGRKVSPYGIVEIYSKEGYQLYMRDDAKKERIVKEKYAKMISDMLKVAVDSGTGKAAKIEGKRVAGKTGTSQDYRDAWFVGYVDDLVCAVWVGNDDNSPMKSIGGGNLPAKIWKEIMS